MKWRGVYEITPQLLAKRLGISPLPYRVELGTTGNILIYCYEAQDVMEIREGEEPPRARIEDPRFR